MTNKIALIYDCIYPYTKGGGEKRFYELGKALVESGYDVHLYGMKFWSGPDVIKKDNVYLHGICPSKSLYTNDGRRSIWQAIYFGIHSLKLIKEDFDVIDCCGFPYFSLFACKLVCLLKGKKLISTWHEVWGKEYWKSYLGKLWLFGFLVERLVVKLPDKIIAVSDGTANRIKSELGYKGPITVCPNGVDSEVIKNIEPSSIKSDIIYVGRLMDFKNVDLLIKSISLVKKHYPDVKCLIIGDGPEKEKLQTLTRQLGLSKNISFTGFIKSHNDVYAFMKSSKVFVLPSTREGFGIVVTEANACGIPVITVDHKNNAAKELIEVEKNGYTCALDEKAISQNITSILKNDSGNSKRDICVKKAKQYYWSSIGKEIERSYIK
ncbi:hypothetical protein A2Z22_05270 [Candidatus Woesebacteria bacterium RBG_16_34_12]|uniref:Glycosyltransferase n=1 Tax=Candidatus Woesebacteria bacterium RBG_16_34_12 TaxID=1802480 RepID=A0A1F7X8G3_9BACT|nr:MAG: hypothetical protein A2Z22_05270 [Candidatus Woesebacteria bacterium RBG_16_34_12]